MVVSFSVFIIFWSSLALEKRHRPLLVSSPCDRLSNDVMPTGHSVFATYWWFSRIPWTIPGSKLGFLGSKAGKLRSEWRVPAKAEVFLSFGGAINDWWFSGCGLDGKGVIFIVVLLFMGFRRRWIFFFFFKKKIVVISALISASGFLEMLHLFQIMRFWDCEDSSFHK